MTTQQSVTNSYNKKTGGVYIEGKDGRKLRNYTLITLRRNFNYTLWAKVNNYNVRKSLGQWCLSLREDSGKQMNGEV